MSTSTYFLSDSDTRDSHGEEAIPSRAGIPFFLSLLLMTFAGIAALMGVFSPPPTSTPTIRTSGKLLDPVVILISSDGFRWDYQFKVDTPNINRLKQSGIEAGLGLIPVYPTVTFPNHYSIVTGLYPGSHGIVANSFVDPVYRNWKFTMGSKERYWWKGEPIWETALKQGKRAATYFWPGSEVKLDLWKCPEEFCKAYNGSVPYEERVDTVLSWVDLPEGSRPNIITLYFEEPDHTGHQVGPDAPQIDHAISRIDSMVGRLLDGLKDRGVLDLVHVILLGDHGMVGNCASRDVNLQEIQPWLPQLSPSWFTSYFPLMAVLPPINESISDVYDAFQRALASGRVHNAEFLSVYKREDLPARFNYSGNDRIAPILGVLAEGYAANFRKTASCYGQCFGSHGYDNALISMRTIFFARGPLFPRGSRVESFRNVEVYGLICKILGIEAAPNNGTSTFPDSVLHGP